MEPEKQQLSIENFAKEFKWDEKGPQFQLNSIGEVRITRGSSLSLSLLSGTLIHPNLVLTLGSPLLNIKKLENISFRLPNNTESENKKEQWTYYDVKNRIFPDELQCFNDSDKEKHQWDFALLFVKREKKQQE